MENKKIFYDLLTSQLNAPYLWGGQNPLTGFDCSGLVCFIYQAFGFIPNKYRTHTQGLYNKFSKEKVLTKEVYLGTLAFYGQGKTKMSHVGIMLNSDLMVEAAGGDSSTLFLQDAKKQNAVVRVRPYNYRKDFIEFITPIGVLTMNDL